MHELVPRPLLDAVAAGADSWRSVGPVLSVDLVGFTSMAWTLAANGDRGAEALADIADTVFAPIVEAIHQHGGYVAEFGGDAILGIFPTGPVADTVLDVAAAAAAIADSAHRRGPIRTRFGQFDVGVKVALAVGEVRWDVLDDARAARSTYVAWGEAVERAAGLAATGSPGQVLLDRAAAALLADVVPLEHRDDRHLLGTADLADIAEAPAAAPEPPGSPHPLAARFAPGRLLTWDRRGELRPVVTAFLGLDHDAPIEDVRRLVSDIFRLIDTYGGVLHQVERAEKGWVVLLYWGAPVSFPGDVERALGLLLALRAQCPVPFRAGTTVGTAFSGLVGARVQVGFSCYGSHINLAARLMGGASPGSLLVDSSVLGNAAGVAAWTSLGSRELKGVGAPVEVFALEPLAGGTVAREHRIVGREAELAALQDAVHGAAVTGRLRRVALVGEPGSGKTVLLDILRRREEGVNGLQWAVCRSESHGIRWLHPVRDLVRRWAGVSSVDDVTANAERFWARLHVLAESLPPGAGDRLLDRGSFLAALLDLPGARVDLGRDPARGPVRRDGRGAHRAPEGHDRRRTAGPRARRRPVARPHLPGPPRTGARRRRRLPGDRRLDVLRARPGARSGGRRPGARAHHRPARPGPDGAARAVPARRGPPAVARGVAAPADRGQPPLRRTARDVPVRGGPPRRIRRRAARGPRRSPRPAGGAGCPHRPGVERGPDGPRGRCGTGAAVRARCAAPDARGARHGRRRRRRRRGGGARRRVVDTRPGWRGVHPPAAVGGGQGHAAQLDRAIPPRRGGPGPRGHSRRGDRALRQPAGHPPPGSREPPQERGVRGARLGAGPAHRRVRRSRAPRRPRAARPGGPRRRGRR